MIKKAIIFGLKGTKLTLNERALFKCVKPWGIILFSRNIKNLLQLKILVMEIKKLFNDNNFPVMIDQEGGRVSRLNKIIDFSIFSQKYFGDLYNKNKKNFHLLYQIYIDSVCAIFKDVGININTVPVLDIKRNTSHNIVGDRSYSSNKSIVNKLGNICIDLYKRNKIATVMKHIPGHGLANCDSHFSVPVVRESKANLIKNDFKPFSLSNSLFAMTAHIIFKSYDSVFTATHSTVVINEVIRKEINFKGILISDDISMKSLKYGLKINATKALDAGCNLVLHCNGNFSEMVKLSKIVPNVDKFTKEKTSQFYNFLR